MLSVCFDMKGTHMNTPDEMKKYNDFMKALTELSRQHGSIIQAVGGVYICAPESVQDLVYITDIRSGDLLPRS